jgi:hypothetical protein
MTGKSYKTILKDASLNRESYIMIPKEKDDKNRSSSKKISFLFNDDENKIIFN